MPSASRSRTPPNATCGRGICMLEDCRMPAGEAGRLPYFRGMYSQAR
jgi:hypothetical protein